MELKQMLEERRVEALREVRDKVRGVRADGSETPHHVMDPGDAAAVDTQGDIEFALIQMKAEILNRIDEALSRLEEGAYGRCVECGGEISDARLRALPFAVRCRDCEEAREQARLREEAHERLFAATGLARLASAAELRRRGAGAI
ncbi:MAG: TraR/DksA family transcriptional regulator [Vicinamibacterales bacterium]